MTKSLTMQGMRGKLIEECIKYTLIGLRNEGMKLLHRAVLRLGEPLLISLSIRVDHCMAEGMYGV